MWILGREHCMLRTIFSTVFFFRQKGDVLHICYYLHPALIKTHSKSTVVKICGSQTIAKDVVFVIVNIDSILK